MDCNANRGSRESLYTGGQCGQLSLDHSRVAKSSTSLAGVKAGMSPLPGGR